MQWWQCPIHRKSKVTCSTLLHYHYRNTFKPRKTTISPTFLNCSVSAIRLSFRDIANFLEFSSSIKYFPLIRFLMPFLYFPPPPIFQSLPFYSLGPWGKVRLNKLLSFLENQNKYILVWVWFINKMVFLQLSWAGYYIAPFLHWSAFAQFWFKYQV